MPDIGKLSSQAHHCYPGGFGLVAWHATANEVGDLTSPPPNESNNEKNRNEAHRAALHDHRLVSSAARVEKADCQHAKGNDPEDPKEPAMQRHGIGRAQLDET